MKTIEFSRKIDNLSDKLSDPSAGSLIRLDFDSFSEPEKLLFRKVDEIDEKYRQTGSPDILVENLDLIFKNMEVFLKRVTDLYCYVVPMVLGCDGGHDIVEYFFKLHFYNFQFDLLECLKHVREWSDKDREDFISDLKKNGSFFFRIPRGFGDNYEKDLRELSDSKDFEKMEKEKKDDA